MQPAGQRYDDRYGYPGLRLLQCCRSCGHCTLPVKMSPDEISDLYTNYYPRSSFDAEAWKPHSEVRGLRAWWQGSMASAFRWVPAGVRVLDIGCGFGESLGYHRKRGCEVFGVETDRNAARVAARHTLPIKIGLFEASDYDPESFDFVTLDQVIEHVADPEALMSEIHRVLKPGAALIVSTPNGGGWGTRIFGKRWVHWHAPYHQQFFTARSMKTIASRAGFELEQTSSVTNAAWLKYQWGHLATYPSEGAPSPYWNSRLAKSFKMRLALRMARELDRLRVNHLLTRLFDALGIGDNSVYVLRRSAISA